MTHFLHSLLASSDNDPLFSVGLAKLEKSAGDSGVDARLIADILEKAHIVMRHLGLDTKDTTARELYQALMACVKDGSCDSILLDSDYVLLPVNGKIISLNLIDVIENAHHELSFEMQISSHGRRSLRGEMIGRYLNHGRTDETVTNEIAASMGLLPDRDDWFGAWYNKYKHYRKQVIIDSEELNR